MFGIIYDKYLQEGEQFILFLNEMNAATSVSAFVSVSLSVYDQNFRFMLYWDLTPCDIQC